MPKNTYVQIASVTTTSSVSSVTFTSISGSYTDLVLVGVGYNTAADGYSPRAIFNSDTGTNYSLIYLGGTGSTASSGIGINRANIPFPWLTGWDTDSAQTGMFIAQFMNYSNTTTYKTIINRASQALGSYPGAEGSIASWRNTSAITSIMIIGDTAQSQTFAPYSTFTLYGIHGVI